MSQARTNQGGSVVSFVVVGIVLVALVAGGIYVLQHRSGTDSTEVTKTSNSPAPSTAAPSGNTPAPTPSSSVQPVPSSPKAPDMTSEPTPASMPATGPSDILPGGIMVAILLGLVVAYMQSRQVRKLAFDHK